MASAVRHRGLTLAGMLAALAVVASAALHLRGFGGAFLSDDFGHLDIIAHADRGHVLAGRLLAHFVEPLGSGNYAYRPLAFLSYAIDWRLFGAWAPGWRATSLALHFASAALVYGLVSRWALGSLRLHGPAMLAAAMFAAFPFAGEVSFWPAGRADLLAAFFSLLFLATLDGGPRPAGAARQTVRVLMIVAALLSKESALPLAVVAAAIDLALRALRDEHASQRRLSSHLRFVGRDLAPSWLACAAYIATRSILFGTPLKVYPDSTLPGSPGDYLERLASYGSLLERQPGIDPPWLWASVAAALVVLLLIAVRGARTGERRTVLLLWACGLAALAYVLAPALLSAANTRVGDGARNFYVAWLYVSLATGFAAATTRLAAMAAVALVGWMLVAQEGSLAQWQAAAREMRALLGAIPAFAERLDADEYALVLVPDHVGVALFGRNAEGAIVDWPIQKKSYLERLVGMTESDVPAWPQRFAEGSIATLKGRKTFDMNRFAGVFCWSPARARFAQVAPAGPVADPRNWSKELYVQAAGASCMPGTFTYLP